ncbi:MAG: porin family protein [Mariniphaga sp.]
MKAKLIYFVALMLLVQIVNAQTFGIKGGINFANVTFSGGGTTVSEKSITGVHFGPIMDFALQENLFLNTGLLFSIKGTKSEDSYGGTTSTYTTTLNYLVVPINLAYKFPIDKKTKLVIQAGPYLGYALSGKDKGPDGSTDIKFGEQGGLKRLDMGLGFGAGVEFGPVVVSLNYELGLANIEDTSSYTAKNKVLQISLAYMFGGLK